MKIQILTLILIVLSLFASACTGATPTAVEEPSQIPATIAPPATATSSLSPEEQLREAFIQVISQIPEEDYAFLTEPEFTALLTPQPEEAEPLPTLTPLPMEPQLVSIDVSSGGKYEFVFYPGPGNPADLLILYFPIEIGLEEDADFPVWMDFFEQFNEQFKGITIAQSSRFKLAAPVIQPASPITLSIAAGGFSGFPECLGKCSDQLLSDNKEKWTKDFDEAIQRLQDKINAGEVPGVDGVTRITMLGKSLGGANAYRACALMQQCNSAIANSPSGGAGFYDASKLISDLKAENKNVFLFLHADDTYAKEFQTQDIQSKTVPGSGHGIDAEKLKSMLGVTLFLGCKPGTTVDSLLTAKRKALESKREDLNNQRNLVAQTVKLLVEKDWNQIAESSFDSLKKMWPDLPNVDASNLSDENIANIRDVYMTLLNSEVAKLQGLENDVKQMEQDLQRLGHADTYNKFSCPPK